MLRFVKAIRAATVRNPMLAAAAIIASALILGGTGLAGGWMFGTFLGPTLELSAPVQQDSWIGNVSDGQIYGGVIAGAAAWLLFIVWLTAPAMRFHRGRLTRRSYRLIGRSAVLSMGVGVLTTIAIILFERYGESGARGRRLFDDTEYVDIGIAAFGLGLMLLCWLPLLRELGQGRPVADRSGEVLVNCPGCGYSMRGLRSTTCPECGVVYELDALIEAQNYALKA